MSRSQNLYQLQIFDSALDAAKTRIHQIDQILGDNSRVRSAMDLLEKKDAVFEQTFKDFKQAETAVNEHNLKIDQNQKRLYSGSISNPKDLEDLQRESESLARYLSVLEDRQLEAMVLMEAAESEKNQAQESLDATREEIRSQHASLLEEKAELELKIAATAKQKDDFLRREEIADLDTYTSTRNSSGGIAVALMVSESCAACGANIPSAIAQEARSPGKLVTCPTCKRILYAG